MSQRIKNVISPRRIWGRIIDRVSARALILMYHRVCDAATDPCLLNVTRVHFEEQMRVVKELGHPMHLRELVRSLRAGRVPSRAVCMTFDDGYADNLLEAKPLLERYSVPATVFATTGSIGRRREFWWDQIERLFLQPGKLPQKLSLKFDGQLLQLDLGEAASLDASLAARTKEWNLLHPSAPTARHAAFRAVHHAIQPLEDGLRTSVLDDLQQWAGTPNPPVRSSCRALELEEMAELERGGLIEVGAHTVNHPQLSAQSPPVQHQEIAESKRHLEEHLGHPVAGFAYPYGRYAPLTVDIVRQVGFEYACACISSPVRRHSQLHLLPRLEVLNWSGDEFAARMRRWLGWT